MADRWCMVCRESSSSEIEISISNEIKTSPKLTSQCMPLRGTPPTPYSPPHTLPPRRLRYLDPRAHGARPPNLQQKSPPLADRQTDANRFYHMSNVICYSYGGDNDTKIYNAHIMHILSMNRRRGHVTRWPDGVC